MTYLLHLETSTKNCSVCLSKNGQPWIVRQLEDAAGHAGNLTLFIEAVLRTAQLALADIAAVSVSHGPGSYTGLRIGVSTAKGLCFSLDKPLIAVSTLQALALAGKQEQPFNTKKTAYVGMLDARRQDAYVGVYDAEGNTIAEPYFCTLDADTFGKYLAAGYEQVLLSGDATAKYQAMIEDDAIQASSICLPRADHLCALAFAKYQAGDFADLAYSEPFYLKKPHITKAKPRF